MIIIHKIFFFHLQHENHTPLQEKRTYQQPKAALYYEELREKNPTHAREPLNIPSCSAK